MTNPQTAPDPASTPGQQWVWLARIRKSQGRKGEVIAEILTDFPEKFAERKQLWLLSAPGTPKESARAIELTSHFLHKGLIVLHFAAIDSIEKAESLRDQVVAIPKSARTQLGEDEVYISDLIGCTLIDTAQTPPQPVGQIEAVDRESGPVALLVIQSPHSKEEILIPFAKAYLKKIDLEARQVEMQLPEGLIEAQLP
jgi:16S rRNA processing protein RimM